MNRNAVVIGLDGGGTYTRALCTDLNGHILAAAQTGGSHPQKNPTAQKNVRNAIRQVLMEAGCKPD